MIRSSPYLLHNGRAQERPRNVRMITAANIQSEREHHPDSSDDKPSAVEGVKTAVPTVEDESEEDTVVLQFDLSSGSYATVLLREVLLSNYVM